MLYGQDQQQAYQGEEGVDPDLIEDAITAEVNRRGFALISKMLKEEFLDNFQDHSLPDVDVPLPGKTKAHINGIRVSLDPRELDLVPTASGLEIRMVLNNLKVNIATVEAENHYLRGLSSTCSDIEINLGNGTPLPVRAGLALGVADHQVTVDARSLDFHLERYQYVTYGPAVCSGLLGHFGRFTRSIARRALSHARVMMELLLKSRVQEMSPRIAQLLNAQFATPRPFELPDLGVIPRQRLLFKIVPSAMQFHHDRMNVLLGVKVASEFVEEKGGPVMDPEDYLSFADVGINEALINRIIEELFGKGIENTEVTSDLIGEVEELLKIRSLTSIWPELEEVKTQSDHVRLFVGIKTPPQVYLTGSQNKAHIAVPDISARFQIEGERGWTNFFTMHLAADVAIGIELRDKKAILSIGTPKIEATGRWASSYRPHIAEFHSELAANAVSTLVAGAVTAYSPLEIPIPPLQVRRTKIGLHDFRILKPFVMVSLHEDAMEAEANRQVQQDENQQGLWQAH